MRLFHTLTKETSQRIRRIGGIFLPIISSNMSKNKGVLFLVFLVSSFVLFVIRVPGIVTNAMSASGISKSTIGPFGDGDETLRALDRSEPANSQHLFRNASSCFVYLPNDIQIKRVDPL